MRAGALYVWLHVNHDAVQEARAKGCGWMKIAEIAIEDGALPGATVADIKRLRCKWQRVCSARAKEELQRSEAAAQREARRAAAAGKPIMPSRLSPDWRPAFVEPQPPGPKGRTLPPPEHAPADRHHMPETSPSPSTERVNHRAPILSRHRSAFSGAALGSSKTARQEDL